MNWRNAAFVVGLAVAFAAGAASADDPYPVEWILQPGTVNADQGRGVALDGAGHVYLTGFTLGSFVQPGATVFQRRPFVSKYDAATGDLVWTYEDPFGKPEYSLAVAANASGMVAIAGQQPGVGNGPQTDGFVRLLDADGDALWTREITSSNFGDERSEAVQIDAAGNVYVAGNVSGDLAIAPGTNRPDRVDGFVTKYGPDGTEQWTHTIDSLFDDYAYDLAIDSTGDLYVVGATRGQVSSDPDTLINVADTYVRKPRSAGRRDLDGAARRQLRLPEQRDRYRRRRRRLHHRRDAQPEPGRVCGHKPREALPRRRRAVDRVARRVLKAIGARDRSRRRTRRG